MTLILSTTNYAALYVCMPIFREYLFLSFERGDPVVAEEVGVGFWFGFGGWAKRWDGDTGGDAWKIYFFLRHKSNM